MRQVMPLIAALLVSCAAVADDTPLFDFAAPDAAAAWSPAKLVGDVPAPGVEVAVEAASGRKCLKLTFSSDAGWSAVATTKIPVAGNWREFKTLKLDLTVDQPLVAYIRILQGKPDEKGNQPYWEKTMILQPGKNEMVLLLPGGIGAMDPAKGNVSGVLFGAFRPQKPQTLLVDNVRLSTDWPWTRVVGWCSAYNHDGYSSAVQREFARTGASPKFKVLGTDLDVADLADLAKKLRDQWVAPEPKTVDRVETEFRAQFDELKKTHPKAVMAVLRDGEKGFDPADPEKVYAGWKMVYISCHGPDGPNGGREKTPVLYDTVEAFMRHRSPLMQADLSSLPKGAQILAAKLVVVRVGEPGAMISDRTPLKPNMWAAEPCNRDWDPASANCYAYATGKLWKAVSGLYYGEDPDYWPVFVAHGPMGTGAACSWDFTEALKFWLDGTHVNHGFFLYGDSIDYLRIFTMKAKDVKQRPAILVVYEPK